MGHNMTRRTALTALAGSLAALRVPGARAAGEKLRVGKAVVENVGFIPLDVGMEHGIFAKHGLEVEELNFAGGAKIAQAMTAGAVDISLSAGPDMQFVAKGAPEIAIGSIAEFPSFMAYVVGANSPVADYRRSARQESRDHQSRLADRLARYRTQSRQRLDRRA